MVAISRFSTPEHLATLQHALAQVDEAIHEATLAEQAGVPQAGELLTQARDARARILQLMQVYFPGGQASVESPAQSS